MKKAHVALATGCLLVVGAVVGLWLADDVSAAPAEGSNEVRIASVLHDFDVMDSQRFEALPPLSIPKFEIPDDSVDVMRARITETYTVDGIGEDTVELTGWVAVKHFNARAVDGSSEVTWENGVVDTEFVGLSMSGYSEVFGPVEVNLDKTRPVHGQVGRIQIPEYAAVTLLAQLDTGDDSGGDLGEQVDEIDAGACVADVNVTIKMQDLNLQMATAHPVSWYSLVETIPPVGHTASIAVEPVPLMSNGREVGKLVSGKVNFREVVRREMLNRSEDTRIAWKLQ